MQQFKPTPLHQLKPQMWFFGKLLGMDLYLAVSAQPNVQEAERKFFMAQQVMQSMITATVLPPKKDVLAAAIAALRIQQDRLAKSGGGIDYTKDLARLLEAEQWIDKLHTEAMNKEVKHTKAQPPKKEESDGEK